MTANPLQKFFRQPKIYVSLPSRGLYYEPGAFQGDYNNVPVLAMTGMDEIIYKTPDALFTGEATAKVIESCCPFIKNAKHMPSIDIDTLLIAIRIATFGNEMTVSHTCKKCGTENDYDVSLDKFLEYLKDLKYVNHIQVNDQISIKIRPLQYEEMNHFGVENFKLQKVLMQVNDLSDAEKQKEIDNIYTTLSELQLQLYLTCIESVQTPEGAVIEKSFIEDWLRNCDREYYQNVKEKLETNKEVWNLPPTEIQCSTCNTKDFVQITMDQSNFFE